MAGAGGGGGGATGLIFVRATDPVIDRSQVSPDAIE
jgi:hypothetical protein